MSPTARALTDFLVCSGGSLLMGFGAIYFKRRFIDRGDRIMLDSFMSERALAFRNRGFVAMFCFFALVFAISSAGSFVKWLMLILGHTP